MSTGVGAEMAREFRFKLLDETMLGATAWPDIVLNFFRESPLLRATALRFDLLRPGSPATWAQGDSGAESLLDLDLSILSEAAPSLILPLSLAAEDAAAPGPLSGLFTLSLPVAFAPVPSGAVAFMSGPGSSRIGDFAPGLRSAAAAGQYLVLFSEDLGPGLVVDPATRQILTGGAEENPERGSRGGDVLVLSGPLIAGSGLPVGLWGLDTVVVQAGANYDLVSGDESVSPGETLEINGRPLGDTGTIAFDGSAESDGRFLFLGGDGDDLFRGGAGDDLVFGEDGADSLGGGGGADVFAYSSASESSGAGYDRLVDFDASEDKIDLPVTVTGFDAAISAGTLSAATLDADLSGALGGLGAGRAVLFAPDSGDLAGTVFLIVDGNGVAGYQTGEDYVFALTGGNLADLSGATGFIV